MFDKHLQTLLHTQQRQRARMIERLKSQGINDSRVLEAMNKVPRHIFVQEAFASRAYEDTALPLGMRQTISQPYIVAKMIEILYKDRQTLGKVLEIGTGCGYQAAVLAQLTLQVFSLERIATVLDLAKKHFQTLKETRIRVKYTDGNNGLPEAAPFDSIIVAAAAPSIPSALLQQLAVKGRLILPVCDEHNPENQYLSQIDHLTPGNYKETRLEAVKFVPLLGGKKAN